MAKRDNHYEAAFEQYLRERNVPYVAVDEAKRSRLSPERTLKNLDFIVSPTHAASAWLVDVKGRQFPAGKQKQYWRNWATREDLRGLWSWQQLFGSKFVGLLVFAYNVIGQVAPLPESELFAFRDRLYGFVGVPVSSYASAARSLSPRWDTVAMPAAKFRETAAPMRSFFRAGPADLNGTSFHDIESALSCFPD